MLAMAPSVNEHVAGSAKMPSERSVPSIRQPSQSRTPRCRFHAKTDVTPASTQDAPKRSRNHHAPTGTRGHPTATQPAPTATTSNPPHIPPTTTPTLAAPTTPHSPPPHHNFLILSTTLSAPPRRSGLTLPMPPFRPLLSTTSLRRFHALHHMSPLRRHHTNLFPSLAAPLPSLRLITHLSHHASPTASNNPWDSHEAFALVR